MAQLEPDGGAGGDPAEHSVAPPLRPPGAANGARAHRRRRRGRIKRLFRAIAESDESAVEQAVRDLARAHRYLAPLTFTIGALMILLQGVRLLFTNWRLTLLQVLPAMWIWAAMLDLKLHVVKGRDFKLWYGADAIALVLAIMAITMASFYLNAVFAMAISVTSPGLIRQAFRRTRDHAASVLGAAVLPGLALGVSVVVVPRWGLGWFALSLGIVIAFLMVTYVTVPARMVGIRSGRAASRKDQVTSTLVSTALGAIVCTPAYVLGRVGLIMLGSNTLVVLGGVLLAVGLTLQAGSSGAVKAVKVSAKLMAGR